MVLENGFPSSALSGGAEGFLHQIAQQLIGIITFLYFAARVGGGLRAYRVITGAVFFYPVQEAATGLPCGVRVRSGMMLR